MLRVDANVRATNASEDRKKISKFYFRDYNAQVLIGDPSRWNTRCISMWSRVCGLESWNVVILLSKTKFWIKDFGKTLSLVV